MNNRLDRWLAITEVSLPLSRKVRNNMKIKRDKQYALQDSQRYIS